MVSLRLPSIGTWLSNKDNKTQAQFELIFMLAPFFVAWFIFIYFWVFLLWSEMDSLPIPCVVASVGYIIYFRWRDTIRDEASGLEPINMTLRWHEGRVQEISNIIEGTLDLSEQDAFNPGVPELMLKKACPSCGSTLPAHFMGSHCGSCGAPLAERKVDRAVIFGEEKFYTKVKFGRKMRDMDGLLWEWGVFIHDSPKDATFKKVPGQWFTHKGQMFRTATAKIDVTYVGFKDEEYHVLYFRVTSDPERTRLIQIGLGITPATSDIDNVNKARNMSSLRVGLKFLLKFREADAYATAIEEQYQDSKTRGYKSADRALDDLDGMRKKRKYKGLKSTWKYIALAILLIVAVIWLAYSMGWIGTPTPSPPPPPRPSPAPSPLPGGG